MLFNLTILNIINKSRPRGWKNIISSDVTFRTFYFLILSGLFIIWFLGLQSFNKRGLISFKLKIYRSGHRQILMIIKFFLDNNGQLWTIFLILFFLKLPIILISKSNWIIHSLNLLGWNISSKILSIGWSMIIIKSWVYKWK